MTASSLPLSQNAALKNTLIDGVLMPRLHMIVRDGVMAACLYGFAGLCVLAGIGFVSMAGYMALATIYPPMEAALWMGGLWTVLAVITACAAGIWLRHRKKKRAEARTHIADTVTILFDLLDSELGDSVRDNPKTAVALAGLAGFIAQNVRC
jgi:hypothetical protein